MSWFEGQGFKNEAPRKKEKQAKINKSPKNVNESKSIIGVFKPEYRKANDI